MSLGKRGPAKTPSNIVDMRGNPGKRGINKREPKFTKFNVDVGCPAWVSRLGHLVWANLAKELEPLGLLTEADRLTFAMLCESYALWRREMAIVEKEGTVVQTFLKNSIQNPRLGIANKAGERFCKLASEFGLSPASRVRLEVKEIDPQGDLFGDLNQARKVGS